jgi:hypothetical protein
MARIFLVFTYDEHHLKFSTLASHPIAPVQALWLGHAAAPTLAAKETP